MRTISGTVVCDITDELETGCCAFVYLMRDQHVLASQTLPFLEKFPFEFSLQVNQADLDESETTIRVTVERGETTYFYNTSTQLDKGSKLEHVEISVAPYVSRRQSVNV